MPKRAKELSALEVKRLAAPGWHAVGTVAGLGLKIAHAGNRAWVLRVVIGAKRREIGLGAYPAVTLAGAHEKARAVRLQIEQGIDPIAERRELKARLVAEQTEGMTFSQCAAAYIKAHREGWKNAKHVGQWETTLAQYAGPVIGDMLVRHVETRHVLAVLEPIWTTKTETATRLRSRIELVMDWAAVRGERTKENPARWRGHLDKLLPKPSKVADKGHHAALPWRDVGAFLARLEGVEGMGAAALRFAILTAARSGEVRGATWSEIDMQARTWTVPGSRMKAGKDHRVPLSDAAVRLLEGLPRYVGNDLVFPAPRGGVLSDMTLSAVMKRLSVPATVHGFRSTFRDWAAESTAYPSDVVEMALAHTIRNKVEAAYRRGDLFEKRRQLMQAWADYCARVETSADVVSIGAARVA
ncbi:tyrosine-type recombinase/integrase [Sphaerotilus sulfidivorans]|nr:bacteriophage P4 integrase [Sphaerotilus natans]